MPKSNSNLEERKEKEKILQEENFKRLLQDIKNKTIMKSENKERLNRIIKEEIIIFEELERKQEEVKMRRKYEEGLRKILEEEKKRKKEEEERRKILEEIRKREEEERRRERKEREQINNQLNNAILDITIPDEIKYMGVPIEKKILRRLTVMKFSEIKNVNNDNKNCRICLENFIYDDKVIYLPCCHFFHKKCIIKWVKKNATCPLCKLDINEALK